MNVAGGLVARKTLDEITVGNIIQTPIEINSLLYVWRTFNIKHTRINRNYHKSFRNEIAREGVHRLD